MFVIKQLIVMVLILASGGLIWYLAWVLKTKGFKGVWQWMVRNGDKAWHYIAFVLFMATLIILDLAFSLWWWVAILVAEAFAFGKEAYDKFWGAEKKWDNGDLLADQLGIATSWAIIKIVLLVA